MKIGKVVVLILACALALSACGGGTDPRPDIFNEENAWSGEVPADAGIITPNEFATMLDNGELSLTNQAIMAESAAELEERYDANVASLQQSSDLSPALQELLDELLSVDDFVGDVGTALPAGNTVVLEGPGVQAEG